MSNMKRTSLQGVPVNSPPGDCPSPAPSHTQGARWSCVGGDWFHQGDLDIPGDWVQPRESTSARVDPITYFVNGSLSVGSRLVYKGAIRGIIRVSGCIEIKAGVLFDWSDDGIPKGYGSKTWDWRVADQAVEGNSTCEKSLASVPVSINQGGCVNANVRSDSLQNQLGVRFTRGTNVCLRNGLLLGFLVLLPIVVILIAIIVYVVYKCRAARKDDQPSILSKAQK